MIIWMAYAALTGVLIATGAFAAERLVVSQGKPRRFVWLAALTLAVLVPLTGIWRRPAMVPVVAESGTPESVSIGSSSIDNFRSVMPALPVPRDASSGKIAMFAWGAGSLACLAVLAGVLVQVARGRRRWDRRSVHGTEVYVSRRFGPALVGVARPAVVIPQWVGGAAAGRPGRDHPARERACTCARPPRPALRRPAGGRVPVEPGDLVDVPTAARRGGNWTVTNASWLRGWLSPTTAMCSWARDAAPVAGGAVPGDGPTREST